jgi:ribose-phosphate pyrophosphokinase
VAAEARGRAVKSDINIKIISGNGNRPLAEAIARRISVYRGGNVDLADARVERFSDNEIFVEVFDNVRGEDVFIVQPTAHPANDNLMELLIMTDALRRASARRVTAVVPYFGYARQDRKTSARTPITAKLVANLIEKAGIDRVLTMDLHAGQIQGFFDMPVDNLYAAPVFALDIRHHFQNPEHLTVVSPDVGGVIRARDLAKRIGAGLAVVDKRRSGPNEIESMTVIGEVEGKTCLICDDIVDTAGTLCAAAKLLKDEGAAAVHAYISHGVLSGPAVERLEKSVIESLVITDSIEQPAAVRAARNIRVVSVAPLLAQAILNVGNDTSVSSLFSEKTLAPIYEAFYRFD